MAEALRMLEDMSVESYLRKVEQGYGGSVLEDLLLELQGDLTFTKKLVLKEHHLYGSSRLGVKTHKRVLLHKEFSISGFSESGEAVVDEIIDSIVYVPNENYFCRVLGQKQFELANHLGNVLATVLDRRTAVYHPQADTFLYFIADVVSATMYYPFGSEMVEYSNSDFNYNYSFNGMEKDNEAKGDGNQLFTLYRVYDTRLGRWLSVDPEEMSYPDVAPYISMDNNPNVNIDPEGDDWWDNVNGLARGSIDNVMGTDLRSSYKPNNYKTYNNSLRSVDAMFTVSSATLTYLGTNKIAAGTTGLISSGVVAGTGAGAPIGAAGAVGSGTLIGVGLLEVGAATVLMSHTSKNISKGYEYGKPKQKTTNSKQTAGNSQNETTTKGRGSNNRQPDTNAKGDHSTFNERGNTTYKQNPQNPSGFDEVKRTDVKGKPHTNKNGTKVATPHVHTKGEKDVIPAVKGKDY